MPELAIVMSPGQDWFLRELMETVSFELGLQGIPSSLHTDGFPEPRPDRVYALPAPQQFVALEGPQALPHASILRRTVFICADPPALAAGEADLQLLRSAGAVFEIDVRSVVALHRAGLPARTLRPGYSKLRDRFDPDAPRPIDVMFTGTHSQRRTQLLARYAPILARHNCLLQVADGAYANATGSSSYLAESKYDLLARTKLVINLHQDDQAYFEWLRGLEAMHCGAVVVSEHASGLAPFVPGEHLLVGGPDSLPFLVEAVLRDGALQQRLRTQAYERLSAWLPFALSIAVLRAALVELVGQPAAPGAWRGSRPVAPPVPTGRWDPVPAAPDPAVRMLERELRQARVDLVELRRQVAELQQLVLSRDQAPAQRVLEETPAWRARRAPQLSVLTAFHSQHDMLLTTLDALAGSRISDYELVVVDDGSRQDSVELATAWLRSHPRLPARLVSQQVQRGCGAARNAGLEHARAPYVLVLEAGDELYPRCLEVLLGTLVAMPDAAFVYPIVRRTGVADGVAPAGGELLSSVFGWEPARLRLGNYIDTPYLVRAQRLRELGGFADEPRLRGLEDYDLWCRIAERGWRGQLAPQILASHRTSISSAESSALISASSVGLSVLAERAPRLMAGIGVPVV